MNKNTVVGIGSLALIAVLAASGFLVVKPQVESAFQLQSETQDLRDSISLREARLIKLQTEKENFTQLTDDVNALLKNVPSGKNVTDIAGAVVKAMPPGVQLNSFAHNPLVEGTPSLTAPESSLAPQEPPFEQIDPGTKPVAEEPAEDSEGDNSEKPAEVKPDPAAVPAFANAPFILTVRASSMESLTNFLDILQNQDRVITVGAVRATSTDGQGISATIYAYAFAGKTSQIELWENPPAETEE